MPTTRTIYSHASMLPEIKTRLFPLSNEINAITRLFENDSRCSPNFRDRAKVKGGQRNKTKHESGGVKTVFHETGSNNFETFFPFPPLSSLSSSLRELAAPRTSQGSWQKQYLSSLFPPPSLLLRSFPPFRS